MTMTDEVDQQLRVEERREIDEDSVEMMSEDDDEDEGHQSACQEGFHPPMFLYAAKKRSSLGTTLVLLCSSPRPRAAPASVPLRA